jgi:hypothetical protein
MTEANDLAPPIFYVSVYDSSEPPELFPTTEAADRWVNEHHPNSAWKADGETVRQRWNARIGWDEMVQLARAEGWYRHGPQPDPPGVGAPDSDYMTVGVAHAGLTTYVYVDKSDAEAHEFLGNLSPLAPAGYTLHTVRMRY